MKRLLILITTIGMLANCNFAASQTLSTDGRPPNPYGCSDTQQARLNELRGLLSQLYSAFSASVNNIEHEMTDLLLSGCR